MRRSNAVGRSGAIILGSLVLSTLLTGCLARIGEVRIYQDFRPLMVGETRLYRASVSAWFSAPTTTTWSSSDPRVATVDADTGLVTGVAPGKVTIWVASTHSPRKGDRTDLEVHRVLPQEQITAGSSHTCSLSTEGDVFCWGDNFFGQVGERTTPFSTIERTPIPVMDVEFRAVAAGGTHTCALSMAGQMYCRGNNGSGQLGAGTLSTYEGPVLVNAGGIEFLAVTAGERHTCALSADGDVYCWGLNVAGQLGDGATDNRHEPTPVLSGGEKFQAIAAGYYHSCALTETGDAYCWGLNEDGQLGDGTTDSRSVPTLVDTPGGVLWQAITAGQFHSCALSTDGDAYCWGRNQDGQLGDGTTDDRHEPTLVLSGSVEFQMISAGGWHSCALTDAGDAYCWGWNVDGQLGDGTTNDQAEPTQVLAGGMRFQMIATGGWHSCALTGAGDTYCWGSRWNDTRDPDDPVPTPVPVTVAW